jgi:ribose transport system substrate-binding protein
MSRALDLALGRPVGSSDHLQPAALKYGSSPSNIIEISRSSQVISRRPGFYLTIGVGLVVMLILVAIIVFQNISSSTQAAAVVTSQAATASVLTQTAVAEAWTPTPLPVAKVLAGERGPAAEAVPSAAEIEAAKRRLGTKGFIAYVACTLDSEFHSGISREIRDTAGRYGLDLRVYDSQADSYKQVTQVERARSDGATALVVCVLDPHLLVNTLSSAQSENIPMVFFAGDMPNYGGVLVAGDNYELGLEPGRLAGKIITEEMGGKANVVILDYPDLPDIVRRADGIEAGVLEMAPGATIVGRYLGGTRESGLASVQKLLDEGVEFNVIASINDAGAFGAIDALKAAGVAPDKVVITSVDAELLAQQYIQEGYYLRGSVQASRIETARALVNSMVKLLAGATLPENIVVPPGNMITRDTIGSREEFSSGN